MYVTISLKKDFMVNSSDLWISSQIFVNDWQENMVMIEVGSASNVLCLSQVDSSG